jgi:hypothetical protein
LKGYSPVIRFADSVMAPKEITPAQALGIIADRIQKRKEILKRASETGYSVAVSELDIVRSQITEGAGVLHCAG